MANLTVKEVQALNAPGRYADGNGLYLRVVSPTKKYWTYRRHENGKRVDTSLGPISQLSLAEARKAAMRLRLGEDLPRVEQDLADQRAKVPTFEDIARSCYDATAPSWRNSKHGQQWLNSLRSAAFPAIGAMAVDRVGRREVQQLLLPIWLKTPETARRVAQRVEKVIRWAVGQGYREESIDFDLVRDALPKQPKGVKHMPAVDWQDVPAFWRQIEDSRSDPLIRMALRWLILTAQRPGTIATASRGQVCLETRVWAIPADLMKGGKAHRVPLSAAAVDLFERARGLCGPNYLFSSGPDPISPDTMRMMMRRLGVDATPHGFRSSFKDWSLAKGYADHLSEKQLAHADTDKVRAAYARSDLVEERRPMMDAWAAFVAGS